MNIIKYVNVGGRLKSTANSENPANDHVVAGANAIFDDEKALLQSNINKYLYNALETICEQLGIELPNNGGNNNPGDNPSTPDNPDNPNPGGNTPIPENLQEILNGLNQAIEDLNTSLNSNSGDLEGLDDRVTQVENTLIDLIPSSDDPGNQEESTEENTLVEVTPSGKLKSSGKKTTDFVQTTQNCKILVIEEEEYNSLESYDEDILYFVLKPWEEWTFGNDFPAILQ